jgi:hypothetical protein
VVASVLSRHSAQEELLDVDLTEDHISFRLARDPLALQMLLEIRHISIPPIKFQSLQEPPGVAVFD